MLVKVEDNKNLSRDLYSRAIINTNGESCKAAKEAKNRRMSIDTRFNTIDKEICSIKQDISSILNLLRNKD